MAATAYKRRVTKLKEALAEYGDVDNWKIYACPSCPFQFVTLDLKKFPVPWALAKRVKDEQ